METAVRLAHEHDLGMFKVIMPGFQAGQFTLQGDPENATSVIVGNLPAIYASGTLWTLTLIYEFLAGAYLALQQELEGMKAVQDGLALAERNSEIWNSAELHRLKGELHRLGDNSDDAEREFLKGLEIAREQEAKSFELRAATSLARLWHSQGKHDEARELLAAVYRWFSEGMDIPDLKDALALLEESIAPDR